jgi:uncharacterized membrane protein YhiD involved in acid resistance
MIEQSVTSFRDLFNKGVEGIEFTNTLGVGQIAIVFLVTFVIGMAIFYVYKSTFQGVLYTQSFNVSLVMVSIVTSLVIMTISTNFILSLGMVGALSIVRFRTAIKDTMDIVFMFWAIAVGIATGAGLFTLAITGSIFISIIIFILTRYKSNSSPYLLILNYESASHSKIIKHLDLEVGRFNIKSKTVANNNTELTVEIRIKNDDMSFVNRISDANEIIDAVLISYNGDYVS